MLRFNAVRLPFILIQVVSQSNTTQDPIINHSFPAWPIPNTDYRTLYLSPSNQLTQDLPSNSTTFSYQADVLSLQMDTDSEELAFTYTFQTRSYLVDIPKLCSTCLVRTQTTWTSSCNSGKLTPTAKSSKTSTYP
jgi:predicted acyl esterase